MPHKTSKYENVCNLSLEIIDYGSNQFEQKKLKDFMEKVEERFKDNENEIAIIKNDEFGYFHFLKATKKWIEDSQKEKLDYYVNSVKNGYTADISNSEKITCHFPFIGFSLITTPKSPTFTPAFV